MQAAVSGQYFFEKGLSVILRSFKDSRLAVLVQRLYACVCFMCFCMDLVSDLNKD